MGAFDMREDSRKDNAKEKPFVIEMNSYIVAGSYDRELFGYVFSQANPTAEESTVDPIFEVAGHVGSVNCVSGHNITLCSSSKDERIQLYNLNTKKEMGSIDAPAEVTSLQLVGELWEKTTKLPSKVQKLTLLAGMKNGDIALYQGK